MMALDLEQLERLAAQATPGPWDYDTAGVFKWHFLLEKRHVCECLTEQNSAYIVAACNAVPELIAELKAEREKVCRLESYIDDLQLIRQGLHNENADLRRQLRDALERC